MEERKHRDVEFLFEVGSLHFVPRAWKQSLGLNVGNILEHIYRVTLIALVLARREGAKDEEKIMKMAMLHDLTESRTLDSAFMHKEYVTRHEEKAAVDMLTGTAFEKDLPILEEYIERNSIEAKIVKDADHLDVDLELKEMEKSGSQTAVKIQKATRKYVRDNKFYTESAKKLWDEIQDSDPDQWQMRLSTEWTKKLR